MANLPTVTPVPDRPVKSSLGNCIYSQKEISRATELFNGAVTKSGIPEALANYLKATMAPKGHPNHKSHNEAAAEFFPGEKPQTVYIQAQRASFCMIRDIAYGALHIKQAEADAEANAATDAARAERAAKREARAAEREAKIASGELTPRPRRPKEVRDHESARKQAISKIRGKLKLDPRGRVPKEKLEKYESMLAEWDEKNPVPEVTETETAETEVASA